MFEHELERLLSKYRFPEGDSRLIRQRRPICTVDLFGASGQDPSYRMNQERDARLEAVLRKHGNIAWGRQRYLRARQIMPSDYDFILLVPNPVPEQSVSGGIMSVPLEAQVGVTADLSARSLEQYLTVGTSTPGISFGLEIGMRAEVRTDVNKISNEFQTTRQVINYSLGRLKVKDFNPDIVLPYPPHFFTIRGERYYFEKAINQVRACVRGFIEDELHGLSYAFVQSSV
jgi:hypothetical protein